MSECCTDILMYHSISDAPGPASISPRVFAAQMMAIAKARVPVVSMDEVLERHTSGAAAPYAIAITFDDGFSDFADAAWPVLQTHGFTAVVYLPSGLIGRHESWPDCQTPPRQLMDRATIGDLAKAGVCFGSHSVTHSDLTALEVAALQSELEQSKMQIEAITEGPVRHFATPYGYSNSQVKRQIARLYATSVGTSLGTADAGSDIYDLPRLEMHYFTAMSRWQDHLAGNGGAYLARRKFLRRIRQTVRLPGPAQVSAAHSPDCAPGAKAPAPRQEICRSGQVALMSTTRQFSKGVAWIAAGTWAEQAINFLVFVTLVRLLGAENFGLIAMAGAFVIVAEFLVRESISEYLIAAHAPTKAECDTVFWMLVAAGLTLAFALILGAGSIARYYGETQVQSLIVALSATVPFIALTAVPIALLRRELRFRALSLRAVAGVVVGGIVGLVMAWQGAGVWSIVGQRLAQVGTNVTLA